jgi:hypothetical protein
VTSDPVAWRRAVRELKAEHARRLKQAEELESVCRAAVRLYKHARAAVEATMVEQIQARVVERRLLVKSQSRSLFRAVVESSSQENGRRPRPSCPDSISGFPVWS